MVQGHDPLQAAQPPPQPGDEKKGAGPPLQPVANADAKVANADAKVANADAKVANADAKVANAEDKDAKAESKETPEQAIARKSASLAKSVAVLKLQATNAQIKQADLEQAEAVLAASRVPPTAPRVITLKVNDPIVMYGYDSEQGGELKKWVGKVAPEALNELDKKLAGLQTKITGEKETESQRIAAALQIFTQEETARKVERTAVEEAKILEAQRSIGDLQNQHRQINEERIELEHKRETARVAVETAEREVNDLVAAIEVERKGANTEVDILQVGLTAAQKTLKANSLELKTIDQNHGDAKREEGQLQARFAEQEQKSAEAKMQQQRIAQDSSEAIANESAKLDVQFEKKKTEIDNNHRVPIDSLAQKIATIKRFEQEIKNIQNGWMNGKPVELKAMQEKVNEFERFLNTPEVLAAIPAEAAASKARLKEFPGVIEKQLSHLQEKTQARVYTNRCNELREGSLEQQILYEKLENTRLRDAKGEAGRCDVVSVGAAPSSADDASIVDIMQKGSNRAYVIVVDAANANAKSLYYVNKVTKECKLVCAAGSDEMEALLAEMEKGKDIGMAARGWQKIIHPKTVRPLHDIPAVGSSEQLTDMQEDRIRELTHHVRIAAEIKHKIADWTDVEAIPSYDSSFKGITGKIDWKEVLPIAIQIAGDYEKEVKLRADEEEADPRAARDNAMERLMEAQNKPGLTEYDYKAERFQIQSKTDDKGKRSFTIMHSSGGGAFERSQNVPEAMAKMIALCHMTDPLSSIELDCPPTGNHYGPFYKRMATELEYAIIAAEKSAARGDFIGITLGENAIDVLNNAESAAGKDLIRRAQTLYDQWEKYTQGVEKKEESAAQKAVGESKLGAVLQSPPAGAVLGATNLQTELNNAFLGKTLPEQKIEVLSAEVKKLDSKIQQFDAQKVTIENELRAVTKEIEKATRDPEAAADTAAMTVHFDKLASLKAAQEAANQGLMSLTGPSGMAQNYVSQMDSTVTRHAVGIDQDMIASVRQYIDPLPRGSGRDLSEVLESKDQLRKEAGLYEKCIRDAKKVGTDANTKLTQNSPGGGDNNLSKIEALQEKIKVLNREVVPEQARPRM